MRPRRVISGRPKGPSSSCRDPLELLKQSCYLLVTTPKLSSQFHGVSIGASSHHIKSLLRAPAQHSPAQSIHPVQPPLKSGCMHITSHPPHLVPLPAPSHAIPAPFSQPVSLSSIPRHLRRVGNRLLAVPFFAARRACSVVSVSMPSSCLSSHTASLITEHHHTASPPGPGPSIVIPSASGHGAAAPARAARAACAAADLASLSALSTSASSLAALILLNARIIPSSFIRSWTTMPRANSRMARLPIFSCRSCHPASSPATVCCVYRSSLARLSASSRDLRARSSFSSYNRCLVSSNSPSGHLDRFSEL